jgi:hypothetical protein
VPDNILSCEGTTTTATTTTTECNFISLT